MSWKKQIKSPSGASGILKFLIILILSGSCRLGSTDQICLAFPELPKGFSYGKEKDWTLIYLDGSGRERSKKVRFMPGRTLLLEVRKEVPLVCLLYPPSPSGHFEPRPAGGLFNPGEAASIDLTWPDGAGAALFRSVASGGLDLESINLRRLLTTIYERCYPDPWLLDWDLLRRQLAKGEMRYWYIRKKHCYELEVPFPSGGWLARSLWLNPLKCSGEVNLLLTLSEGTHSFWNSETGQVFVIVVEESGEFFTLLYDC